MTHIIAAYEHINNRYNIQRSLWYNCHPIRTTGERDRARERRAIHLSRRIYGLPSEWSSLLRARISILCVGRTISASLASTPSCPLVYGCINYSYRVYAELRSLLFPHAAAVAVVMHPRSFRAGRYNHSFASLSLSLLSLSLFLSTRNDLRGRVPFACRLQLASPLTAAYSLYPFAVLSPRQSQLRCYVRCQFNGRLAHKSRYTDPLIFTQPRCTLISNGRLKCSLSGVFEEVRKWKYVLWEWGDTVRAFIIALPWLVKMHEHSALLLSKM